MKYRLLTICAWVLILSSMLLSASSCFPTKPTYDSQTTVTRTDAELSRIDSAYRACLAICDSFRTSGADISDSLRGQYYIGSISCEEYGLTEENAVAVSALLGYTSYENYWLDRRFLTDGGRLYITINAQYRTASARAEADAAAELAVETVMAELDEDDGDYARCLAIHDYICRQVSYARGSDGAPTVEYRTINMITVFRGGQVVCQGYARAFGFLCGRLGVECISVVGPKHIWNRVRLDGEWYNVDVTFDDENDTHRYFCAGQAVFDDGYHGICTESNVYEFFYTAVPEAAAADYRPT